MIRLKNRISGPNGSEGQRSSFLGVSTSTSDKLYVSLASIQINFDARVTKYMPKYIS